MTMRPIHRAIVLVLILASGVSLLAASQTRTATADGTTADQWAANTGTKWEAVASDDGDTTYITESTQNEQQYFLRNAFDISAVANSIDITVGAVCKETSGEASIALKLGGFGPTSKALTTSYATYEETWTTNPENSNTEWTEAQVESTAGTGANIRQGGVQLLSASTTARCTYWYMRVDYTDAATGHRNRLLLGVG